MNDDKYGGELHAWIEPELEARIVAMVLGEASEFEVDELERMMEERPELRIFMRRVQVVHGLLGEAVQADEDDEWRLAPERRAEVMKAIGVAPAVSSEQAEVADQATGEPADQAPEKPVVLAIDEARERRVRRAGLKVALMAAACLMISVLIAPFFMTAGTKSAGVPRSSKADHLGDVDEEGRTDLSFSAQSDRVMRREAPPAPSAPSGGVVTNERLSVNLEGRSFAVGGQGRHSGSDHWDSRSSGEEVQKKLAALKESIGAGRSVDTTSEIEVIREFDLPTEYEPPELPNSIVAGEKVVGFPVTPATPTEFGETELARDGSAVVDGKSELAKAEPAPAPVNRPLANGILPPRTETSVSRSSAKPKVPAPAKPAAPESRMAKVVAATIPAPTAVPVPDVPAVDGVPVMGGVPVKGRLFANKEDAFGTGDDLGDSWWGNSASGSGGGGMDENGDRAELSGGVPLRTDLPPETLEGTPAPLGTTGFIAQGDVGQPDSDVRKDADGDGLAAAEELGFGGGVAGDGQRFGMQLRLGAERQDFGAEEEREDLGRVRGGDMLESLVDGEGESKPRSGELDGRIIEGFADGADLEERTSRGMTASRSKEKARIPGRKSGSQPAGEPAPVVADDDLVWTDPEPSDAPDEGKSVDIKTKHVDVRQANLEELSFDWTVQDAGAKANLKSEADEKGRVSRNAAKGRRSGDAAISRNSIDAILNNPDEAPPGILSITGVFSDGQEQMIKRRLAEKAAASETRDLLDRMPADADYDDAIQGGWNRDLSTYTGYQVGGDAAVGGGSEGGDWSYLDGGQREGLASEITAGKPVDYAFRGRTVSEEDDGFMRGEPNDPIRTSPGIDSQHGQNVDKVRRELYTGEGLYNLGKFDEANEHFESVLRTDPYNAAARRWMERISSTKSSYYRAAYDETRARMLTEVDKAWEQAVPPEEAAKKNEVDPVATRAALQDQLELVEKRLEKMAQVVSDRRDEAVDRALESHDYIESKREYENAQQMLQAMKLQNSSKRISLRVPKAPVKIHEEAKVKKKSGGFLGLGAKTYEGQTVVQVNPTTPELDPFGGELGGKDLGGNMTRQFFATELEVIEADQTLKGVVDELGLKERWKTDEAGAIKRLKDAVSTEQVEGTDLVKIKVEEKNAADAKAISDKVAKAYAERRKRMEMESAQRALTALDAELRDQEDLVEEKRKVLDTIVQSSRIAYVEGVAGSGEMGRSQERVYELAEMNYFELEKEQQELDTQIKRLLTLEGDELDKYAAGLQPPENGAERSEGGAPRGGVAYMSNPLDSIVIPEIDFENTTVEEALDFLRQRSRELDVSELDPDKKGVNLVLRKARVDGYAGLAADAELDAEGGLGGPDPGSVRIEKLKLENVTLGDALKAIEDQTGLRRRVDDYAVTLLPAGNGEGDDMLTRRWQVPASFVKDLDMLGRDQSGASDPFASDSTGRPGLRARRPLVDVLKDRGISFPEGASAAFIPGTNTLVVKSTPGELERMDQIVEKIGEGSPPVDYMGLYEPLGSAGLLDESEAEDELTMRKLKETRIPVVDFDSVTVEEAVEFIRQHTKGVDVDGDSSGIDFAIRKPRVELSDFADDPELAVAADPGEARIGELKLRNVPAAVVLKYVAEQANLRYQVRNGRVVLMPLAGGEGEDLTTRAWKLHPDVIEQMRKVSAEYYDDADDPFAARDQRAQVEQSLARMTDEKPLIELMKENGVSFPEGASVAYLPDSQVLVVKNTPSNMDLVDALAEMTAASLAQERQSVKANEKSASEEAFSTFSLHVSDVSFKLAQAALERGEWPDAERIRVEEFVNAFDYGDPAPTQKEQVACQVEQSVHPFMQQRNMLRIAMRTAAVGRAAGTPLRLTILLDHSGSMERTDRVESVQRAFQLLAAQLNPQDEVTLISFARTPRLLRERVKGDQAADLARVIAETPSEGGTNLEEALRLGIEKATEGMQDHVQDRIILLTDGAANLGNAQPEELAKLVEEMRQKGIAFDACGVGAEGLNDDVLEALTRKGDGRYYFLNRPEDADAGFAKQIAGALRPAAKNVKVQVEFNPKRVGHYRLYGFEKHELKKEDFRNDSVDAAELAAEEAGVAIYQVEPLADGEGDIGTVSVRFQDMSTGEMVEKLWPIPYEVAPARLGQAAPSMQLAASAAFLGEALKGTPVGEAVELRELSGLGRELQSVYASNERVGQLVDMIEKARAMTRQ